MALSLCNDFFPISFCFIRLELLENLSISVQSLSHVQLCDPMDCSMPGFPVYHQLSELAQTHVHQVSDAIQPSHPLSLPSPPTRLPPVIHPQCISNQDSSRLRSFQFSSVAQSWLTLCNPMNCSTPGLPVHTNSLSSPKLIRSFSGSLLFLADPLEKTLMLGKIKSKRRRGRQGIR